MRLVQFEKEGRLSVGVELKDGGDVVDVRAVDSSIPNNMKDFLQDLDDSTTKAQRVVDSGKGVVSRSQIKLKAPIYNPEKLFCAGMNYADHCHEQNMPIPTEPMFFNKFASSIVGTGDPILYNEETKQLDYEVELAIVIGKQAFKIKEEDAMNHIAGYTVAHDVSARDWQLKRNGGQWLIGKTFDSFCPLGPAIVTKDSISDVHKLGIRCRVNGKTVQDSTTENFVFKVSRLVSFLSRFLTLRSGDVILTGTPPGVGCFKKPPVFLQVGDVVECEIDEIGCISNQVCHLSGL